MRNHTLPFHTLGLAFLLLVATCLAAGCSGESGNGDSDADMTTDVLDQDDDQVLDMDVAEDTDMPEDGDMPGDDDASDDGGDTPDADDMEMDAELCPDGCGDNQVCTGPDTCECEEMFGDCDGDPANGCEESLLQAGNHCGICGASGIGCERENIVPLCEWTEAGQEGICQLQCQTDYYDADGVESSGCETGLLPELSAALSGDLPGTVLDVALDGDMVYVLVEDGGSLKIVPVDTAGGMATVGTLVDTGATPGTRTNLVAQNGVVAVTGGGTLVIVYELDGTTLSEVDTAVFSGAADVSALPSPVTANALAEIVAVSSSNGTRWWGIYPMGQEPGGLPGGACGAQAGSSATLCRLDNNANPSDGEAVLGVTLNGKQFAVAVGSADMVELEPDATPELTGILVNGDDIPSGFVDWSSDDDAVIYTLEGSELKSYEYSFGGMNPSSRAVTTVFTSMDTARAIEVLDADRVAAGTDVGLTVVVVGSGASADVDTPMSVAVMDSDGARLAVVDDAKGLSVFALDFSAVE